MFENYALLITTIYCNEYNILNINKTLLLMDNTFMYIFTKFFIDKLIILEEIIINCVFLVLVHLERELIVAFYKAAK